MNIDSEKARPWSGMSAREKTVWAVVYTRYADDPGLAVMKANQAIVGLRSQDLDGPPPDIWVEPSQKGVPISFEDWKIWYRISFKIRYRNKTPAPELIEAEYEKYQRGKSDFW
jgi:hypothetical protein